MCMAFGFGLCTSSSFTSEFPYSFILCYRTSVALYTFKTECWSMEKNDHIPIRFETGATNKDGI